MASPARRLATNVPGDVYVDSSCIDCDTCRWMAPEVFDAAGDQSRVHAQPADERSTLRALQALLACPTGSIGTLAGHDLAPAKASFPLPVDGEVFHCGYHAESSFGAASYLVVRTPERGGNVLVDSPRFTKPLCDRLDALGGVSLLFLTHRDDVADHARFAERYGCRRVIHAADVDAGTRDVETRIEGLAPVDLDADLRVVPTPGHTAGSACLIHRSTFLFSGDHVAWSPTRRHVYAFRDACWHDWDRQIESMERLAAERFEWILPGHGRRCRIEAERMPAEIARCVAWMRARR
jgi:glyoxylase-like metal-dependent hydrolase (beta-lactamase superfamily II)/ferredoxin